MTSESVYYAVIFSSQLSGIEAKAYAEMAARMETLARSSPGFLGIESAREDSGFGVTVSYWKSLSDIKVWRAQLDHREAQRLGQERWYGSYTVRIARVEDHYSFNSTN
ncbi:MAG: antibiotic biosynthesis monooxygenase [Planctomycetota bacterium]|nr:antibiotic biosynthesis monooxygenase [Planctomycetota bacterium]